MRVGVSPAGFVVVALALVSLITPTAGSAQARDIAGVITELKPAHGAVEVQAAGATEWRPVAPLQALRAGDTVRATADASAVVLLAGGRGSVMIETATSPFSVPGLPAGESAMRKGAELLRKSLGLLSTTRPDPTYVKMGMRGVRRPPVILSPRNGPILPGELHIEWSGIPDRRYTVTIIDPGGVQVRRVSLQGPALTLRAVTPVLSPGTRYRVQVTTGDLSPEVAWFEILDGTGAEAVRLDLAELEQAAGPNVSKSTLAVLKAEALAEQNLLSDARHTVLAALKSDPDEPSLHLVLGSLYKRMGLIDQAAESFEEAALLSRGSVR
jgi:hypothetical protein